jgi:hypothetical protein
MPENTSNTYNAMIDYYDDDYVPEYEESDYSYTYTYSYSYYNKMLF